MHLSWIDYGVLALLLSFSMVIGIYQGCFLSKQLTTNEFLIADGRMKILPTAMSLLASLMSAAALLGIPLEIYSYGTMYVYWIFAYFIGTYLTVNLFIPMFRQIGNLSIYAYLEQRFSITVRIVITICYILVTIFYIAVILYGPSLALSQVTGLHIWLAVLSCGIICTIYTSIGGMKAVIWTDVIQTILMFLGVILSVGFGFYDAGGVTNVVRSAMEGNRIQLSTITWDPSIRYTVWSIIIGGGLNATAVYACLQTQAQRYLCVKSTRAAQKVAWVNFIMCAFMLFLSTSVGLLLYTKYNQCDPLRAKLISKPDQLYPLFIIETLGRFPGLTGLFVASILSASLSTVSSGINSITTVVLEDIYKSIYKESLMSDEKQATVSKLLSVLIGLLVIFIAIATSFFGNNIIVIVFQISGSFAAPILGVFLVGFFVPRVNSRSILVAFTCCLLFQTWVLIGATLTVKPQIGKGGRLPTSVEGCLSSLNSNQTIRTNQSSNFFLPLYSISVMWYSFNAVVIIVVISLLGTLIFGSNDPKTIDQSLLLSWKKIFSCCWKHKKSVSLKADEINAIPIKAVEQELILLN
ncbi:unnamed protein product [Rotaria magnacalcarata]|uniref:Sodium-coupled monocarboxylate transporter 1 n=6 Tax=Rotaria magnacalcarata TaxID=392030 RepID=A0A816ZW42_9BILA|nr:unnamed protein product [Rotaria magnacalcarata]CAF1310822.1 unnamed protein product [Rotaria magnacalcarata]CAF2054870.1 unnamed protein product [Rotaria magnacalcarata]CAF2080440.1 unnamed protein product [Rotaria magnacalcarata]CAF2229202.1 unnamed protein product [Rotaria magnacalcarata]